MKRLALCLVILLVGALSLAAQDLGGMEPGDLRVINLTIDFEETRFENGYVLWEPDRNVRRARYATFLFSADNFFFMVGDPEEMSGEVTVLATVVKLKSDTYSPTDPNGPQPQGGFTFDRYITIVESVMTGN